MNKTDVTTAYVPHTEQDHRWSPWAGDMSWCEACGEVRFHVDHGEGMPLTPKAATATRDRVILQRRLERVTRRM